MENTQNSAQNGAQNNESIGKRIARLRKGAGLTQEQLAERLGVSPQAVSKWENDVSCPDISILPQLAGVFNVTTDALLGREALNVPTYKKESKNWNRDRGGLWFGLIIVLAGLALLCGQFMEIPFAFWPVVWSAVLLGVGVAWLLKRFSFISLGVALLGLYFLLTNLHVDVPFALTWPIGIAAGLVLVGLTILWDHAFPPVWKEEEHRYHDEYVSRYAESAFSDTDGHVDMRTAFGEDSCKSTKEPFKGGSMWVHFGSGKLDLHEVRRVEADAALRVDVRFGSAELWLPSGVRAEYTGVHKSFGDVDEHGAPAAGAQTLTLTGSVSFGSVEIHYL